MKNDLTTRTWQDNIRCPINIILFCTSDVLQDQFPNGSCIHVILAFDRLVSWTSKCFIGIMMVTILIALTPQTWDTVTGLNIQMPMPMWAANTGTGMTKPVLTPITWIVPLLLDPIRTSFGNLCKLVPCTLVGYVLDPKNIPMQVLIPIRVFAYPVLITGMCSFW
jgi:hypothetical protein